LYDGSQVVATIEQSVSQSVSQLSFCQFV
jgi:hypothetical protein